MLTHTGSKAGKGRAQNALWSLEEKQGVKVQWFSAREAFL